MTLRKKVASALSFAHLTGFAKARSEDETDDDQKARSEDEDQNDQDREDGDVKKGKKAKKAEDDKDEPDAEDDDLDGDEDDDADEKKSKKAKADDADDDAKDDDSDEEMRGKSAAASARRRERARCAAIFGSKAAGKNPALAANLAFNTSMGRKEALVVLENSPATSGGYPDRSARNPSIGSGGALQQNSRQAISSAWDKAFAKVAPRR